MLILKITEYEILEIVKQKCDAALTDHLTCDPLSFS
jgi:hypothetical protein